MDENEEKKNRLIQSLEETKNYNQKSIDGIARAVEYLPFLHDSNQLLGSQIQALRQIPSTYFGKFPQEASKFIDVNRENAFKFYGQVQQVSPMTFGTNTSATQSSAATVYNWLDSERDEKAKKDLEKAREILKKTFSDEKMRADKKTEIRILLMQLLRPDENRYDLILEEAGKAKVNVQTIETLSLSMRTLLEKIKGELKQRLPQTNGIKDNKILPAVADQLVDTTKSSPEYRTFLLIIDQYNAFTKKLTDIGKWNIQDSNGVERLEDEFDNVIFSLLLPLKPII